MAVWTAGVLLAGLAHAGPAINQFEVKDLDSAPGDFEFQSQNAWSTGQPRRKWVDTGSGELVTDDNTVAVSGRLWKYNLASPNGSACASVWSSSKNASTTRKHSHGWIASGL